MLQYLINTTAIWLMSLVLFDVFLRRESYHNYNRFYLLFTFLLGALLPLGLMQTAPGFRPGQLNGKNVIGKYPSIRFWNHFKIKDHKLYDMDNGEYKPL